MAILARQLNLSRTQVYAILNGDIKRPPDWARFVRPLVGACTGGDAKALAEWRRHHAVLVDVCEELRRRDRSAYRPPSPSPMPSPALPEAAAMPGASAAAAPSSSGTDPERGVFPSQRDFADGHLVKRPRQLPSSVPYFSGRRAELKELDDLAGSKAPGTVVISAIGGTAGVGKTTLAVHWARRVSHRFPDGQLYLDLRGFTAHEHVMPPEEAIRILLDGLEVPSQHVPVSLDAQIGLYRSLLAGRRMLIMLDNARDTDQIRSLLPGEPGCLVIVTSRNQLTGLIATDGAHPIDLDVLSLAESRELLASRLGHARLAADPQATEEIILRCAQLPLALVIAAARASTYPRFPLSSLAAELAESHDSLSAFAGESSATDLQAVFSWSYRDLTQGAARLFRLLGIHPGPDLSAPAAASLAGQALSETRSQLAELARAHLIFEHTPGRYKVHDLLRVYASAQAMAIDPEAWRQAAICRMMDHYLRTGHAAAVALNPHRDSIALTPRQHGATPEEIGDHEQALSWFAAEHPVLLAIIDCAAAAGFDTYTWQLAWTLPTFLDRRGHWQDQVATQHAALAAAQRLSDVHAQAIAHRLLAHAYTRLGLLDDARADLQHALSLSIQAGDQTGQGHAHYNLAQMWGRSERPAMALKHSLEALKSYKAAGHLDGQASALNSTGWYQIQLGNHEQALTCCRQALTLYQQLNDRYGQGHTWDTLGYAHHGLGHHAQAIDCYQASLSLFRDLHDHYDEGEVLHHLGDAYQAVSNIHAARSAWQQALAIFNNLKHHDAGQVKAKLDLPNQN